MGLKTQWKVFWSVVVIFIAFVILKALWSSPEDTTGYGQKVEWSSGWNKRAKVRVNCGPGEAWRGEVYKFTRGTCCTDIKYRTVKGNQRIEFPEHCVFERVETYNPLGLVIDDPINQ